MCAVSVFQSKSTQLMSKMSTTSHCKLEKTSQKKLLVAAALSIFFNKKTLADIFEACQFIFVSAGISCNIFSLPAHTHTGKKNINNMTGFEKPLKLIWFFFFLYTGKSIHFFLYWSIEDCCHFNNRSRFYWIMLFFLFCLLYYLFMLFVYVKFLFIYVLFVKLECLIMKQVKRLSE